MFIRPNARAGAGILIALGLLLSAACGREDDPLNEVERFRIMAIKAEPPAVQPGETAVLSSLVYDPEGRPLAYSWNICPVPLNDFNNFECPVTEEMLIEQLADAGIVVPPFVPISFELGAEPTAELPNLLTEAVVEALCAGLETAELPEGTPQINCDESFVLYVRLEVRIDDATLEGEPETAVAIKELPILLEADPQANTNPPIDGVLAKGPSQEAFEIAEPETTLAADEDYDLIALIETSASESFISTKADGSNEIERETLFVTWFITGGSTDTSRTSFIDGDLPFDDLLINAWSTPKTSETDGEEQLFLVLQDERGGVEWLTRTVLIEEQN